MKHVPVYEGILIVVLDGPCFGYNVDTLDSALKLNQAGLMQHVTHGPVSVLQR